MYFLWMGKHYGTRAERLGDNDLLGCEGPSFIPQQLKYKLKQVNLLSNKIMKVYVNLQGYPKYESSK